MTSASQTRKPRKAPQAVQGVARWIGGNPTQERLNDGDAILQITVEGKEAQFYFVAENEDSDGRRLGFRLVKIDGLEQTATYDLEITSKRLPV